MFPHERSLVKQLEGKPFALIGVNSDRDKEKLKKDSEAAGITWRSFWNWGGSEGTISEVWNIRGWPTLYVVDANGVIRYKYLGSPGGKVLNENIATLLKEAGVEVELTEDSEGGSE